MHDQNYSFVVRIWLESTDTKYSIWRGSIEQVGSASRIFFSDFKEISRFIEEQIKNETTPVSSDFQQVLNSTKETFKNYWMGLVHKLFRR